MAASTYILFLLGCLGATDILLYHSIAHGIRSHADSRLELWIHSLRGPTYAALFLLLPNFALHGAFFWMLIGIFVFDVAVSIADFLIEAASREFLGGLPSGEYVLHMIIAMLFGALVASVFYSAWPWAGMTTQITYEPAGVPHFLRMLMALMAVFVLGTATMDARAAVRLSKATK